MPNSSMFTFSRTCICGLFLFFLISVLAGCQLPFGSKGSLVPIPGSNKNPCVVLAVPDSGPYAPVAAKIKKGAAMAVEELEGQGVTVRLEHLNTEKSDWLAKLDALPESCQVVGGPLQEKKYLAAKQSGILQKRIFFSFVPTLQKGDEGIIAWRFFPSPKDQVEAVTKFALNDLNIRTFGAFYPSDSYGDKMSKLLESALKEKHVPLKKASYNPSAPGSWSASVKPLINPVKTGAKGQLIPQTDFEALFVPDSWKNMDLITTSLIDNGEDRLVLMGTTLWEASLSGKTVPKAVKYELAVFPGAWNRNNAPKKLQSGNNDFWSALGFDFVNFASHLGLETRHTAPEIIAAAQKSTSKIRGMAPLGWDNNGIARQSLYIFQVGSNGMKPVNLEDFKRTRNAVQERAVLRMQSIRDAVEAPAEPTEAGEAPEIVSYDVPVTPVKTPASEASAPAPAQPPLSTVPQPSYKLRLPTKR